MGWIRSSLTSRNVAVLSFFGRRCLRQTMVSVPGWELKWFGAVTACMYLGFGLSRERRFFASISFPVDRSHPSLHLAFCSLCKSDWVPSELRNKWFLCTSHIICVVGVMLVYYRSFSLQVIFVRWLLIFVAVIAESRTFQHFVIFVAPSLRPAQKCRTRRLCFTLCTLENCNSP